MTDVSPSEQFRAAVAGLIRRARGEDGAEVQRIRENEEDLTVHVDYTAVDGEARTWVVGGTIYGFVDHLMGSDHSSKADVPLNPDEIRRVREVYGGVQRLGISDALWPTTVLGRSTATRGKRTAERASSTDARLADMSAPVSASSP